MAERHTVTNWAEYNKALINSGNIFFYLEKIEKSGVTESKISTMGRPRVYSNTVLMICHSIKYLLNFAVPDDSHVCRRLASLGLHVQDRRKYNDAAVAVVIDSTSIVADGAYCTKTLFKAAHEKGIETVTIPPRTLQVKGDPDLCYAKMNEGVFYLQHETCTRTQRREQGKREHDDGIRSRIESAMVGLKQRLGRYFTAKTHQRRHREMIIKVNLLNMMQSFGLPKSLKCTP